MRRAVDKMRSTSNSVTVPKPALKHLLRGDHSKAVPP